MKKIICFLLATALLLSACAGTVICSGAGNDMYNAYLSALNNGFIYYSLYDIDKNGVTELIVYKGGVAEHIPSFEYELFVYTMKNGKLAYVGELNTKDKIYGSSEKGLWTWLNSGSAGNEEYNHYLMNKEKISNGTLSVNYYYNGSGYTYYVNNKKSNKNSYDKIRNSLFEVEKYDDKSVLDELKDNKGQIGEVINHTVYTDIVARINGCDIPSYNINGYTAVAAEDLRDYGFEVIWDGNARTLSVLRNFEKYQVTSRYEASEVSYDRVGKRAYNVLRTDIQTYVNGNLVTGHNIDGKTIIYFNDLAAFGGVSYDDNERVLSLEMEGLSGGEYKAYISKRNSIVVKSKEEYVKEPVLGVSNGVMIGCVEAYLNGKKLWEYESGRLFVEGIPSAASKAFVFGDTVYFGTWEKFLALDLYTGAVKWAIDIPAYNIANLTVGDDGKVHIYYIPEFYGEYLVISENGKIVYGKTMEYDEKSVWQDFPSNMSLDGNIVTFVEEYLPVTRWQRINIISK